MARGGGDRELSPEEQAELARWQKNAEEKPNDLPSGWGWTSTNREEQQKSDDKVGLTGLMKRIK